MDKTANYNLPQWVETDPIRMKPFNDAFDGIDLALKANADAAQALQSGKADAQTVSALAKNLGAAGHNCRIAFGSYTGTGAYGSANPNTLQFDFKPALVFIAIANWDGGIHNPSLLMRPRAVGSSRPTADSYSQLTVTWGDRSVAWYMNGKESPYYQLNVGGQLYYYTAIGYDE